LFVVRRFLDLEQSGSAGILAAGKSFQEQFVQRAKRSTWDEEWEFVGSNANGRDLGEVLAFFENWRRSVSVKPKGFGGANPGIDEGRSRYKFVMGDVWE
jgi:hypothetical protein